VVRAQGQKEPVENHQTRSAELCRRGLRAESHEVATHREPKFIRVNQFLKARGISMATNADAPKYTKNPPVLVYTEDDLEIGQRPHEK
jgi:hypothetical protein